MNNEQWGRLLDSLELKFELRKEKDSFKTEDDLGHEMVNDVERLEFSTDDGDFKIERVTRPLIIDKKVHYSHSAAGKGKVEYILSDTDKTHKVNLYKWDNDDRDWREVSLQEGFKF